MDISVLNEYVQTIGHTAHYRMVRTMGGQYYENFVSGRYIAVGPNDITLHEIIGYGQFHLDLSTDGIFKNISEYLDRRTDREMRESIKNSMDSLKIDTPSDFQKAMIELYQTQNENRKEY